MTPARFKQITSQYRELTIGVVGDICLDRYLEIDPVRQEHSLETGLPVHNVINVRSGPGAAGTVINNLCALGVKRVYPVGFRGNDAEGWELQRALERLSPVSLRHLHCTPLRRTFTYTKPLILETARTPRELSRLDFKNWSRTPGSVEKTLAKSIALLASKVDVFIVLDQVDHAGTGVVTQSMLKVLAAVQMRHPALLVLADSRRGLRGFPPAIWKMNRSELARHASYKRLTLSRIKTEAIELARKNKRPVFVTMAERGMIGASPAGDVEHVSALPTHGEIDVVGAGDAVTANLMAALASGATTHEAMELAMAAASIVIHKLGNTGIATPAEIKRCLVNGGTRKNPRLLPR